MTTSMLTGLQEISIYRGETKRIKLSIVYKGQFDSDGKPVPVKLTDDHDIILTVKRAPGEKAPVIQKRIVGSAGIALISPGGGTARCTFTTADTLKLEDGIYKFDVWLRVISLDERYLIVPPRNFNVLMPLTHLPR